MLDNDFLDSLKLIETLQNSLNTLANSLEPLLDSSKFVHNSLRLFKPRLQLLRLFHTGF